MIDVNLKGTIWLARAAVRQFRAQGDGGDIVVIGSVAGLLIGGGKEAVYAATKGAQINLGTAMDRELRGEGIRTTVIAPAGVNTAVRGGRRPLRRRRPQPRGRSWSPPTSPVRCSTRSSQPRRMRTELWTMWSLAEQH